MDLLSKFLARQQEQAIFALTDRLLQALAIINNTARETMLEQAPFHAIALLNEDEQRRLYALLKGTE
jgi:hypothetical protein